MSSRRLLPFVWLLWIVFAGVSIFLLTRSSVTNVSAQVAFLRLPVYGNPVITSLFDHEYPTYDSDMNGIFTRNDGQRWEPPDPVDWVNCTTGENCYDGHDGIDYDSSYSRVLAAADGEVILAGWNIFECYDTQDNECGFGLRIVVDHGNGYETLYGHLSATAVRVADVVQTGGLIATGGETGRTGGPHLHFTVRLSDGTVVDPYGWQGETPDPWEQQSGAVSPCLWLDATQPGCIPPVNTPPTEYETVSVTVNDAGFNKGCLGGGEACWLPLGSDLWGSSQPAGDWARWQPTLVTGAIYEVRVQVPDFGNSRVYEAAYAVQHANGTTDGLRISQNDTNDADRWYYLGRYTFNSGSAGYLELEEITLGGYNAGRRTLAGSVQFVRVSQPPPTPTPSHTPIPTDQCPQAASNMACTPTPTQTPTITPTPSTTPTPSRTPTATLQPPTPTPTPPPDVEVAINMGSDDAGYYAVPDSQGCSFGNPSYALDHREVYFGKCSDGAPVVSGLRFAQVPVPRGALITKALIEFTTDGGINNTPNTEVFHVQFQGEVVANSPTFGVAVGSRPQDRTALSAPVTWFVGSGQPWSLWDIHHSSNVRSIVQQIVNLPGWQSGSPMMFVIQPVPEDASVGVRRVVAFERQGSSLHTARLQIWYVGPTATPTPVVLNTGWRSPTANVPVAGGDGNGFEQNPANGYGDDGVLAVDNNSGTGAVNDCYDLEKDRHLFYHYGIGFLGGGGGANPLGIEVRLDAKVDNTADSPHLCVQLSWNGGANWTTARWTPNLITSEKIYVVGASYDTWGRVWQASDFSNDNFRVRVVSVVGSTVRDFSLDWVAVKVYYLPS